MTIIKNVWVRRIVITVLVFSFIWFVLPLFFNKEVNESREAITSQSTPLTAKAGDDTGETTNQPTERSGTFSGVAGHQAGGQATLISSTAGNFIRLEDNFSVTSGPDLYLYVGDGSDKTREIAKLKGNKGGQNYQLPSELDIESFSSVWIYCKAFSVNFAKAEL